MCQILAVTGHRPTKLGGYSDDTLAALVRLATVQLTDIAPARVLTGMAQGWDTAVAIACINLGIPFTACIPCTSQDSPWPLTARQRYSNILSNPLCTVHQCSTQPYDRDCMLRRNVYMIDNCTHVLALYDGTPGGTHHAVNYALRLSKPVRNCWTSWTKYATKPT